MNYLSIISFAWEFFPGLGIISNAFKSEEYGKMIAYISLDNTCFEFNIYCWGQKKNSLVSWNRSGKIIYHSPTCIVECVSEYTFFNFKKQQTNKQQPKQESKKAKETKEEKRMSPENWLKNINLLPPGWRFLSSVPETRVFFFFGLSLWWYDQMQ